MDACVSMSGGAVVLQLAHLASHYISAHVEKPPEGTSVAKNPAREQTTGLFRSG